MSEGESTTVEPELQIPPSLDPTSEKDLRLMRKAVRCQFEVEPQYMQGILTLLQKGALDKDSKERTRRLNAQEIRRWVEMQIREEQAREELELKRAIVKGRIDEGASPMPAGVLLIEKPCTTVEDFEKFRDEELAAADARTKATA